MKLKYSLESFLTEKDHAELYGRKKNILLLKSIERNLGSPPEKAVELLKYRYVEISDNDKKDSTNTAEVSISPPSDISYDTKYFVFNLGATLGSEAAVKGLMYASKYLENRYGENYSNIFLYNLRDMLAVMDSNQCCLLKGETVKKMETIDRFLSLCLERREAQYASDIRVILYSSVHDIAIEVERWVRESSNDR